MTFHALPCVRRITGCGCAAVLFLGLLVLPGCSLFHHVGGHGPIITQSTSPERIALELTPSHAVYQHDRDRLTSFWISDAAWSQPSAVDDIQAQVLHVELLWYPAPGRTPIDDEATNASLRLIVLVDGEVGVYAGAGFVQPHGKLGSKRAGLTVKSSSLSLEASTDGFADLLTPAQLQGSFTATLDPTAVRRTQVLVSQCVSDALGRSVFVQHDQTSVNMIVCTDYSPIKQP
jgi:hypothetical protein